MAHPKRKISKTRRNKRRTHIKLNSSICIFKHKRDKITNLESFKEEIIKQEEIKEGLI